MKIIEFIKRTWFILLVGIVFLLMLAAVAFSQTPEAVQAMHALERDQSARAVEIAKQASEKRETSGSLFYLGYFQLKAGQRDDARTSFDKAFALDNKDGLSFAGKGYLALLEGNITEAKRNFDKALNLSKMKNVTILKAVAEAWLTDAKFATEAVGLLEKAKSIDDADAYVQVMLGDAYLSQNNGGLAVSSYERAAKLAPTSPTPHYKIAKVYLLSRNNNVAIESLKKAIAIDPSYTLAYKELGELHYLRKEADKAVEAYKKYLSLTERPEIGKIRYAFFLFMAKNYSAANEIFEDLAAKEEVSPVTLRFYAFSLFEAGDYQKSRNIFEKYFSSTQAAEIEVTDYAYYGKLLLKQNDDSLAVQSFRKSLALDKNQPDIQQVMAETLFRNRKYVEAIDAYKTLMALRSRPTSQDYYALGRACYFTGHFAEADSAFQKLIAMQPDMAIGYLWEARTKANLDPETEEGLAKSYYEKVIEIMAASKENSRNELIEAYSYMGYYHFLKEENNLSKDFWEKVIALNPGDEKAQEALRVLR